MRPFGGYVHGRLWAAAGAGWTPAKGPNLFSWMRGDDPDASINTTPDPDQYAAIPDRGMPLESFAQATSGNQPQLSTDWTPSPVPLFTGGRRLQHSAAPSSWVVHNGTENLLLCGIATLGLANAAQVVGTFSGSSLAAVGFNLRVGTGGNAVFRVHNGSGSTGLNIASSTGAITANVPFVFSIQILGTSASLYLGGSLIGTDTIPDPSENDPDHSLVIGSQVSGGDPMGGAVPELVAFRGQTLPDRARVENYLTSGWVYSP